MTKVWTEFKKRAVAIDHAAAAGDVGVVELLRILRRRDAGVEALADGHVHDDGLDQHLRQRHVQLGDDALDDFHVLPRGVNQQRTAAFVGNDFCLAEQLDLVLAAAPPPDARCD